MLVPKSQRHEQSVESCMKQVTEASSKAYTQDRRTNRSQEASRKIILRNESKKHLMNVVG